MRIINEPAHCAGVVSLEEVLGLDTGEAAPAAAPPPGACAAEADAASSLAGRYVLVRRLRQMFGRERADTGPGR